MKDCETPCAEIKFVKQMFDKLDNKLETIIDKLDNNINKTYVIETLVKQHEEKIKENSKDINSIKIDAAKISIAIGVIASAIGLSIKVFI